MVPPSGVEPPSDALEERCLNPLDHGGVVINITMPNYETYHVDYANIALHWFSSDNEETYKKNLVNRHGELKNTGLIDNQFTYKFNSLGFRCEEFSQDPTIMFLGCSNTIGTGLPVDTIWPELVANKLNMRCANLGISGGSMDTAFRLCHGYIDKIQPKIVVLMPPQGVRCEFVCDHGLENLGTWLLDLKSANSEETQYKNFYKLWAVDDNNDYFNREKNMLAIDMLCSTRNIKFVMASANSLQLSGSLARDLQHHGVEAHRAFADKFVLKL